MNQRVSLLYTSVLFPLKNPRLSDFLNLLGDFLEPSASVKTKRSKPCSLALIVWPSCLPLPKLWLQGPEIRKKAFVPSGKVSTKAHDAAHTF